MDLPRLAVVVPMFVSDSNGLTDLQRTFAFFGQWEEEHPCFDRKKPAYSGEIDIVLWLSYVKGTNSSLLEEARDMVKQLQMVNLEEVGQCWDKFYSKELEVPEAYASRAYGPSYVFFSMTLDDD
jgi:hypothetical protein